VINADINADLALRLTDRDATDQRLTHIAAGRAGDIYERHFIFDSRGLRKQLNIKDLHGFRILFHQFEKDSKQNGHLALLIPASAQTYPQILWTKDVR
jgi:hypothetical protein